jgi:hypothetical protein
MSSSIRLAVAISAAMVAASLAAGVVSADPNNKNSRYIYGADCDGQSVDLVTESGAAAQDLNSISVFALMGATVDGVWVVAIPNGQIDKVTTCTYSNFGHDVVIYGRWSGQP